MQETYQECRCCAEIKADEKGVEDIGGEIIGLTQRRTFLKKRIAENKVWAAHYDKARACP